MISKIDQYTAQAVATRETKVTRINQCEIGLKPQGTVFSYEAIAEKRQNDRTT